MIRRRGAVEGIAASWLLLCQADPYTGSGAGRGVVAGI